MESGDLSAGRASRATGTASAAPEGFAGHWRDYWALRSDAGHRHSDPGWIRLQAGELLLLAAEAPLRVLDLACGVGDLYPGLAPAGAFYVGADLSPGMLGKFRTRHPEAPILQSQASELPFRAAAFDRVYANGLCQYLGEADLRRNMSEVRRVLRPGGAYVLGSIPDRQLRLFFYAEALRSDRSASLRRLCGRLFSIWRAGGDDGIGRWYSRREISRLASESGLSCRTFSSTTLEYRFNAVLGRDEAEGR